MSKHFNSQQLHMQGLATVEFTLLATVFFLALFVMIGFAKAIYTYNAAAEATRFGARLAVVCDPTTAQANIIKTKMVANVPGLAAGNITVNYVPAGCSVSTCTTATVAIAGFNLVIATPSSYSLSNLVVPSFSSTLVRESMNSTNNAVCS